MHPLSLPSHHPNHIHKPRCFPIPRQVDQQFPILPRTGNTGSDKCPRQVLWIKIHLRRNHDPILKSRSGHHTSKTQKGRFRKRPKERKPLLHQPTLTAPSLQRQPPTPIHPPQVPRHIHHRDPPSPPQSAPRSNSRDLKGVSPFRHRAPSEPLTERRPRSASFPFTTTQNPGRTPHEKSRASTRTIRGVR